MKQTIYADHGSFDATQHPLAILKQLTAAAQQQLRSWKQRSVSRERLANLPAYQLDDIGITEAQRQVEVNKSFWEV
jgi:uncharacterized protein YjiS (DUF1127 family)